MPVHRIRGSDGQIHRVEASLDASPDALVSLVEETIARGSAQKGFGQSFVEGAKTVGDLPEALGFGVKGDDASRQDLIAAQASEGAQTSWEDVKDIPSFMDWSKQVAGQSMGYLATPGAAAGAAKLLTKGPGAAKVAGYGMLGAQYLTNNLGRQAAEDSPASIGRAALAAAGQTGLDAVGMQFFRPLFQSIPLVRNLVGAGGPNGARAAEDILSDAFKSGSLKYSQGIAMGMGKGIAFEIPQEIAQQAFERWSAGLPLSDEDARREYGEAAAGAALLGGAMGGVSGISDTRGAKREVELKERLLKADVDKRQREAREAAAAADKARKLTADAAVTGAGAAPAVPGAPTTLVVPGAPVAAGGPTGPVPTREQAAAEHAARVEAAAKADAAKRAKGQPADPSLVTGAGEMEMLGEAEDAIPMGTAPTLRTPPPAPAKPPVSIQAVQDALWDAFPDGQVPSKGTATAIATTLGVPTFEVVKKLQQLEEAGHLTKPPGKGQTRTLVTPRSKTEVKPNETPVVADALGSVPNAANPDTGATVDSNELSTPPEPARGTQLEGVESVGVGTGEQGVDQPAQGAGELDGALTPTETANAEDETAIAARNAQTKKALDDAEAIRQQQEAKAAPPQKVDLKEGTPEAELADAANFLRRTVPKRPDTQLLHNRLTNLVNKVRTGQPVTDRERAMLKQDTKKWGTPAPVNAESFEQGEANPTLQDILRSEDRVGETYLAPDKEGVPVATRYKSKIERVLDHIIAKDKKGVLSGIARQILETVDPEVGTEARTNPAGVKRVGRIMRAGKKLNTPEETEKFRRSHGREKYGDSYLRANFKEGEYKGERERTFKAFRFDAVVEGAEQNDNDRKHIAKLKKKRKLAEYNARTNTFYFTNEGMTDKTVMHELLHAYTVRVLHQYETDSSQLSDEQIVAAEQINKIMIEAMPSLKARFPQAFENVFEFVSYAMTEPQMQDALKNLKTMPEHTEALVNKMKGVSETKHKGIAQSIWTSLTRAIARLVGFRLQENAPRQFAGNALIELAGAISDIMTVPKAMRTPESGIKAPVLYATAKPKTTKLESSRRIDLTWDEVSRVQNEVLVEQHDRTRTIMDTAKYYATPEGWEKLILRFQNDRRPLKLLQDMIMRAGKLVVSGEAMNHLYDALTLSTQKAHFAMAERLQPAMSEVNEAVREYAETMGLDVKRALAELDLYLTAEHEPERRHAKFLRFVPLENTNQFVISSIDNVPRVAAEHRKHIFKLLADGKVPVMTLRAALEGIVAAHADANGFSPLNPSTELRADRSILDEQSELYSVINYSPATLDAIRENYAKSRKKAGDQIDTIKRALKVLHEETIALNREANYWTEPVDRTTEFYGWQHYIPFKGKPEFDEEADGWSEAHGGTTGGGYEMVEKQESFMGRETAANNSILQSQVDAAKSALRVGRKDVSLTIKNLMASKYIRGYAVETVKFADRYDNTEAAEKALRGDDKVLHYLPNGDIEVLRFKGDAHTTALREAVRRAYREPAPILHFLNQMTGFMGHMHTRYNPAFAPYNFVRDMMTNAFTMSATFGGKRGADYVSRMAKQVATGGMAKARRVAWAYNNGQVDKIRALAKDGTFEKSILEFLETGGRVAYIQGVSQKGSLDQMTTDAGTADSSKIKNAFFKYVDTWSDLFELTSRAAAYASLKDQYMNVNKMTEDDARIKAAADAKNLANFEQIGTMGRQAGALFMFFRPAATGAVAALDAIRPILVGEEEYMRNMPEALRADPGAVKKIKEEYQQHLKNAKVTVYTLLGAGAAIYMMALLAGSDDDDVNQDGTTRNRVKTDDMAVWTRNIRLPLSVFGADSKNFLQIPWGFGLGAFASMGAQVAATANGQQSIKSMTGNAVNIALDSFIPLPVSRINAFENPTAWFVDSLMPSTIRPFVEWSMNTDGLGREIYNDRVTKYGDSMLGGQNVPEMYHSVARWLSEKTNGDVDIQPQSMYFWSNNYLDGALRVFSGINGLSLVASGQKDMDFKTDSILFTSFIGRQGNVDAREFTAVEGQLKVMQSRLKMFKGDEKQYNRYLERFPYAPHLVKVYQDILGDDLKDIRAKANAVRASKTLSPRERKSWIDFYDFQANLTKRQALDYFARYGITP